MDKFILSNEAILIAVRYLFLIILDVKLVLTNVNFFELFVKRMISDVLLEIPHQIIFRIINKGVIL